MQSSSVMALSWPGSWWIGMDQDSGNTLRMGGWLVRLRMSHAFSNSFTSKGNLELLIHQLACFQDVGGKPMRTREEFCRDGTEP